MPPRGNLPHALSEGPGYHHRINDYVYAAAGNPSPFLSPSRRIDSEWLHGHIARLDDEVLEKKITGTLRNDLLFSGWLALSCMVISSRNSPSHSRLTVKPVIEGHGLLFFNLLARVAFYYRSPSITGWLSIFQPLIFGIFRYFPLRYLQGKHSSRYL